MKQDLLKDYPVKPEEIIKKLVKHKNVPFPKDMFNRLEKEKNISGINANSIVILAVDAYLKRMERERKK